MSVSWWAPLSLHNSTMLIPSLSSYCPLCMCWQQLQHHIRGIGICVLMSNIPGTASALSMGAVLLLHGTVEWLMYLQESWHA